MIRRSAVVVVVLFLAAAAVLAQMPGRRREVPQPVPADAVSVDAIVAALYASVSHAPDAMPDFERMRGIFLPVGMLIPPKRPSEDIFTTLDVDGLAERVKKSTAARKEKGEPPGFVERELSRRTDCFGNVCQIFSTYESKNSASDEKPRQRGINSIQLVKDGKRWWIASVIWDVERPDNPIPASYLPPVK
ncbi:MAG: hypothetical protein ACRD3M_10320 [Thermoanaerobaculia bacterium]